MGDGAVHQHGERGRGRGRLQAKMAEANYMSEYNEAVEPIVGKCGAAMTKEGRSFSRPLVPIFTRRTLPSSKQI